MDKKGIFVYLLITFVLSAIVQVIVFAMDLGLLSCALLVIPAVAAVAARKMSVWPGDVTSKKWPLDKKQVLRIALITPLVFVVVFAATTLVGLSSPDWRVGELMIQLLSTGSAPVATAMTMPATPLVMLALGFILVTILGPTLCAAGLIGMEYGWRGYLLPRLLPLGRWPAYAIGGVLWGLSIAPVFVIGYPHSPLGLLLLTLPMAVVVSCILGEVWRMSRHIGLTAVCCGCFAAQASGMWTWLFPESRMSFPWAGAYGVASIMVWAILAAYPTLLTGRLEQVPNRNV